MILVFAEQQEGAFKKAAFEALTYGAKTAKSLNMPCEALVIGKHDDAASLGEYGADKVHVIPSMPGHFDSQVYTQLITGAAEQLGAKIIVLSHSSTGKSLTGRLAVSMKAGSVAGANAIPKSHDGEIRVEKTVFSGKAFATYAIKTEKAVISVMGNSIKPEKSGSEVSVKELDMAIPESRIRVKEVNRVSGKVPLPEAELVVSAGRGMKDASNWDIIEELADVLGATTACSRPVADAGWRPHHEHVGQTGISIRPNLYLAIGISGAIQHLAGVNNSRVIVVINKDPEAPFFKAADYGVCADLFDVVPRLTKAVKKFKDSQI